MLPLAYTFGQNHKIKILVSSSNYPKYQSNPNLPIADGEFFRRQPNDGRSYTFNGQTMMPRPVTQTITAGGLEASFVTLPVWGNNTVTSLSSRYNNSSRTENSWPFTIQQNSQYIIVSSEGANETYQYALVDITGKVIASGQQNGVTSIATSKLSAGVYFVRIVSSKHGSKTSKVLYNQ